MRNSIFDDSIFWLLFIFSSLYILCNIGTGSLTTWDEAVYANISGGILKTGDWLVMHQGPRPWFDKPPLYMWCTAIFYNMLGINEFSTRLTSAIFGIATILLVYVFMKKITNKNMALSSAILLLAAPHYLHYSKMGMMDVQLTFFITLMVVLFWIGKEKSRYLFWSGIVLFLAYLAKGMAAVSGPAIILLYCLFSGSLKLLIKREFIAGILISLILISGWHALQYLYSGPSSINNYFGFHLFKRATQPLEGHIGGINFYQKVVFNKNKPWGVLYYPSLVYLIWLALTRKDRRAIILSVWVAAVFIICTIVRTKLNWYIMPIYPAIAMASAVFLDRVIGGRRSAYVLTLIVLIMLVQVPVSWAFKLDFNPNVKAAALNFKKLSYEDDGTIFYYKTVNRKNSSTN